MIIDFDSHEFNPSFLSDLSHDSSFGCMFHVSMSDFLQSAHEYGLPDDIIQSALDGACDFFLMDHLPIEDAKQTGVFLNNPTTFQDDKLGFSREQMLDMGIHDENSLSLICTHEVGHTIIQYMTAYNQISPWQTELFCDALMGVRAVLERIDSTHVENSLKDTMGSQSHPYGEMRETFINYGKEIAQSLLDNYIPITTDNILSRLFDCLNEHSSYVLSEEARYQNINVETHSDQQMYTQEEINAHKSKAQKEMDFQKGQMRDRKDAIQSRIDHDLPTTNDTAGYNDAASRYNKAKAEFNKWDSMKPEEK